MKYEEFLKSPEIYRDFNNMFEKQKEYYKSRSKEYGLPNEDAEMISIKLASVTTDIFFTEKYNNKTGVTEN